MDLSKPATTKHIWEQIEPYWDHKDLPSGQRFLGSVRIDKKVTEEILDIVQQNLAQLDCITTYQLEQQFGAWNRTWVKILTFALSEYAYYDDGEHGYWQGLCDRLEIELTQGTRKALQQVAWQGIKDLGLVRSSKANRYVSSLWLQSGIPRQSLGHFADLLQNLDYDWWDMAHADPVDLAQLLCDVCQQKYPQRGRLLTFLRSSCPEDHEEDVDPISGTLLQGLATVAHELERRGESPEILRDENQRTRILQNYSLPNTFFLRSWDSLINVLTPRKKKHSRQAITSQRKKPLNLLLDISDSFDIQLVLPEQAIYRKEWKRLLAEYCTIPESNWEGGINLEAGIIKIPERRQTITQAAEQWTWQLKSHKNAVLLEWHHEGIKFEQLCLIFDAETGELRSPEQLEFSSEVVLFTPDDVEREYGEKIELIDSFVPCSLNGWRGHLILCKDNSAEIVLRKENHIQQISWQQSKNLQPQLQGIRLRSHNIRFLDTPTLWYPPELLSKTINVLIEDLTRRSTLSQPNEQIHMPASTTWQEVNLSQWIKRPGSYNLRLWNSTIQWTASFEIHEAFQLNQAPSKLNIEVLDRQHIQVQDFPIVCPGSQDFWLEELTIKGLWPLEQSAFELINGKEKIALLKEANSLGSVSISLASFRDVIPESDQYLLTWFCDGENWPLLSLNFDKESWSIDIAEPPGDSSQPHRENPYTDLPEEDLSVNPSTFWIELDKRKIRQFQELITTQIQEQGLRNNFSISYDKSLPEFVIVKIINQNYEPILRTMCSSIEKRLHRKINLIRRASH